MNNNKLAHSLNNNIGTIPRFFFTFIDNYLVSITKKIPSRGPLFFVWDITADCNLRCPFCEFWKKDGSLSEAKKNLPLVQKIKIIKNIADSGVWFLSLCGGEPLLCNDLENVIRKAKSERMIVNVSTNGLLLEEKAEMLVKSGVDFITISIDGPDADTVDKIRGCDGLFEKIENGINAIRVLSEKSKVFIEARYLINKKNYHLMEGFAGCFGEKVDSIVFKSIYRNTGVSYAVPEDMKFSAEDEPSFIKCFEGLLKKHKNLDTVYHRNIPIFIFHPEKLKDKFLCFAGTFFAGADITGNLFPCHELTMMHNISMGNLNGTNLIDIWRSAQMDRLRDILRSGARCECWMDRFSLNIPLQKIIRFKI